MIEQFQLSRICVYLTLVFRVFKLKYKNCYYQISEQLICI